MVSLEALPAQVLLESLWQPDHVVIHRNSLDELFTGQLSLVALAPDQLEAVEIDFAAETIAKARDLVEKSSLVGEVFSEVAIHKA